MSDARPAGVGSLRPGAGSFQIVQFPVSGMTCGACVNRITRALRHLDGVDRVRVDLRRELVTIRHDPMVADGAALERAVAGAGYEAHLDAVASVSDDELRSPLARLFRR